MKFIDTYDEIVKLKDKLKGDYDHFLTYYEEYIHLLGPTIKKELFLDSSKYDFNNDIKPILINAFEQFDLLEIAHDNLLKIMKDINIRFKELFQIQEEIDIYFYLGLCNAAGWATTIDGKKTVLLGAEKIVELKWHEEQDMIGLVYHELCHLAHELLRQDQNEFKIESVNDLSIWNLYSEGFAMRYEQKLIKQDEFYHQNKNNWLNWCKEHKQKIKDEYLRRILNEEKTEDFYGDWNSYEGHGDLGYYLGCEFIKYIEGDYTIKEIANLNKDQLYPLVFEFLKSKKYNG